MLERRGRVLLVDEDPVTRLAIERQLDALGWDALVVGSGEEAVSVATMGVRCPVLLTDVRLPDFGGMTLAWKITLLSPRTRVVYMGVALPYEAVKPRNAPFLLKPFSTSALSDALAVVTAPAYTPRF
jgi:DNA-binding NtrC family response regulator